jgi:hypothetical protein
MAKNGDCTPVLSLSAIRQRKQELHVFTLLLRRFLLLLGSKCFSVLSQVTQIHLRWAHCGLTRDVAQPALLYLNSVAIYMRIASGLFTL